jgi:nicotinate-nucleotide pyrophosphorylase
MFISQNQLDYRGSAQPKAQKIMAAKTKAEEDICEEAIILEVENQNLKHLIEQGVECISYDNMSLSEKKSLIHRNASRNWSWMALRVFLVAMKTSENTFGTVGSRRQC